MLDYILVVYSLIAECENSNYTFRALGMSVTQG